MKCSFMRVFRSEALNFYLPFYRKLRRCYPDGGSFWLDEDMKDLEKKIRWICKKSGLNADYFLNEEW